MLQHTAVSNRHFYHYSSSQHCGRHNKTPPINKHMCAPWAHDPKGAPGYTHSLTHLITHSLMWRIHFFVHYITAGRCKPTVCRGHIWWFPAWCIRNGTECLEQKLRWFRNTSSVTMHAYLLQLVVRLCLVGREWCWVCPLVSGQDM